LEGTFKGHLVQHPCNEQGHLQLDQVAQSPVQSLSKLLLLATYFHLFLGLLGKTILFHKLLMGFFSIHLFPHFRQTIFQVASLLPFCSLLITQQLLT